MPHSESRVSTDNPTRCTLETVELVSVPADYGGGANDGAYYPVGLLTLGTHLQRTLPDLKISVVDMHHAADFQSSADLVGVSASSTLNYRNVLSVARKAKANGAIVILGGPHVTQLAEQVLRNRQDLIDYVVRGNGEVAFASLLEALRTGSDLSGVPNLSWRSTGGEVRNNPSSSTIWKYDDFLPLNMSLLCCGLTPYWDAFKARIDTTVDAALVVFTHFGCGYREMMQRYGGNGQRLAKWCSYCSLNDPLSVRSGNAIVAETLSLLRSSQVPTGSNVLLKCYGDNVGTQQVMLNDLASATERSDEWRQYRIGWTFYAQSSRVSPELVKLLVRVGTRNLYIGFDSADDEVQRLNGLGTSVGAHRRAVHLCYERGIKIQAGFVLGCAGETQRSLDNTLRFAEELARKGVLERINSAVLFIIPGSPAYSLLCEREPWIRSLDELPTEELQWLWIRHFCPNLGRSPADALEALRRAANHLDRLSPGPHASMGFVSDRLVASHVNAEPMAEIASVGD